MTNTYHTDDYIIMRTPFEINEKKKGSNVYIVVADNELGASTTKMDIDKYIRSFDMRSILDNTMSLDVLYGYVLDLKELPYEIPKSVMACDKCHRSLYLIYDSNDDGIVVTAFDSTKEVTEAIEELFQHDEVNELADIVVIIGEELDLAISTAESGHFLYSKDLDEE